MLAKMCCTVSTLAVEKTLAHEKCVFVVLNVIVHCRKLWCISSRQTRCCLMFRSGTAGIIYSFLIQGFGGMQARLVGVLFLGAAIASVIEHMQLCSEKRQGTDLKATKG